MGLGTQSRSFPKPLTREGLLTTATPAKLQPLGFRIGANKSHFQPQAAPMEANHRVSPDTVQFFQFNNHGKLNNKAATTTTGNVVIDLDLEDDQHNLDQDCVFLKTQKINLMHRGNNRVSPICVDLDGYFEEDRELRGIPKSGKKIPNPGSVQCVDDYDDDNDDIRIVTVKPSPSPILSGPDKRRKLFIDPSMFEVGESSGLKCKSSVQVEVVEIAPDPDPDHPVRRMFTCEICADSKPVHESFKIKGCSHSYCFDCIKNYVASKLQDGVSQINCPVPTCPGLLEPEYCREILPFEVFDRWGKLLCESVILASQKFYCPFKDCSALLIDDGGEAVTQSECPSCFRMFCAQCKVGWHDGIDCAEYQKLRKDEREKEDIMLRNLARQKQWQRCPKCNFYVEKASGCLYIICRCGTAFCYNCGSLYTDHTYHYCAKCGH